MLRHTPIAFFKKSSPYRQGIELLFAQFEEVCMPVPTQTSTKSQPRQVLGLGRRNPLGGTVCEAIARHIGVTSCVVVGCVMLDMPTGSPQRVTRLLLIYFTC